MNTLSQRLLFSGETPPEIGSVVLSDSPQAGRFTSGTFSTAVNMTEDGDPASTKKLKASVQGTLKVTPVTDTITNYNSTTDVLTFQTSSGLSNFPVGSFVRQSDSSSTPTDYVETSLPTLTANSGDSSYNIAIAGSTIVIASVSIGGWYSNNGGTTWTAVNVENQLGMGTILLNSSFGYPVSLNGTIYYAIEQMADRPQVLIYTSNGSSWNKINVLAGVSTHTWQVGNVAAYNSGLFWVTARVKGSVCYEMRAVNAANGTSITTYNLSTSTWGSSQFNVHSAAKPDGSKFFGVGSSNVSGNAVKVSTNGGASWSNTASQPGATYYYGLAYGNGALVAVKDTGFYTSLDDGASWTFISASNIPNKFYWSNGSFWGVNSNGFHRSFDGLTWTYTATRTSTPTGGISGGNDRNLQGVNQINGKVYLCVPKKQQSSGAYTGDPRYMVTASTQISGNVASVDLGTKTMTLANDSGGWANGSYAVSAPTKVANATLYLTHDSSGTVSDLQSSDPGFVTMTGSSPYTLTFPATLPSGYPPDTDLPAGTTLTVEAEASNSAGSDTATSNTITPA